MDLIVTDALWRDLGTVRPLDGDFAFGEDENDFSLTVSGGFVPEDGALVYDEGGDVGGIVRGYESSARDGTFSIVGDTWTGVLEQHVIGPDAGRDYLVLSGDVRDQVAALVDRAGCGFLFEVDAAPSGIVCEHTYAGSREASQSGSGRHMGCWSAVWQVASSHGCSVRMRWDADSRRVALSVAPRADYTDDESASTGAATVRVSRRRPVNHLVCLGKGELADREVVHLYSDQDGAVGRTQALYGADEIADTYEDGAASGDELVEHGTRKLRELFAASQVVSIRNAAGMDYALGDLVGGTDAVSGVTAAAVVSKRVTSFDRGIASSSYTSSLRG